MAVIPSGKNPHFFFDAFVKKKSNIFFSFARKQI